MTKKDNSYLMISILLTIVVFMLISSKEIIESVSFSISIWKDNLFPTLFPFFVISNLLMNYGFVSMIGKLLQIPMNKLFNMNKEAGFVLAASLISGFPSGAKYTADLVKENIITRSDASRLLTFTHYSNPLFIIGMIGTTLLNNKKVAILILIAHILSGIFTGIILNRNYKLNESIKRYEFKKSNKSFGELLQISIFDSLRTMFLLLGVVSIFLILTTIINEIVNLPPFINTIVSGIFEMTQGVKNASMLNYPELVKVILITAIISFGGLSVHTQVISIISEQKIKYKYFLLARILHSILASIFVFMLYILF